MSEERKYEIGQGLYQVSDLSQILSIPGSTVRRILNEYWDKRIGEESSIRYSWGSHRDKYVNFFSLIEIFTFEQLRKSKISVRSIIRAHQALSEKFNTPYPFAIKEILSSGGEILFKHDGGVIEADRGFQIHLKQVIEPFCKKIDFGESTALRYWPIGRNFKVVVDPKHQYGQPIIAGTNIKTETVYSLYKAGDKVKFIASIYEVEERFVKHAIKFHERELA